jgi:plastocyanin
MQHRNLWSILSILAVVTAAACGGGGESESAAVAEPAAPAFDPSTAGNISGMVMVDGELPAPEELMMNSDPNCAMATNTMSSAYVGSDGHLGNVFVYVKEGLGDQTFPVSSDVVNLNQEGCRYTPHVMGIQVGQTLNIINSDATLHNIHATPAMNQEFNMGQPIQGMQFERTFDTAEVMVPFRCDVHGWMNAYIGVLEHPFFAVTAEDGMFDLSTLPPGDYVIEAWHEELGAQTQNVTVATGETAEVSFTFSVS